MTEIDRVPIRQVTEQGENETEDVVVRELSLTITLNNQEAATLLCSPTNLNYLAVGFLFSEGLIENKGEIEKITVDEGKGIVQVETKEDKGLDTKPLFKPLIASGGGRGTPFHSSASGQHQAKIKSQTTILPDEVFTLVNEFQHRSHVFKATGGVHSAALCDTKSILVFSEDIGRHNAIDKVFGECILRDIAIDEHIVITSGRISSEILLKAAKGKIPILISVSAPTNLGVRLATELGMTLIGFAREKRMNVYTNAWRVVTQKRG
jgi:FdhD protein